MILSDREILKLCELNQLLTPYMPSKVTVDEDGKKVLSYGPSAYSYDIRAVGKYKISSNLTHGIVDPLNVDEQSFHQLEGKSCVIPPGSFMLTHSQEYFRMPSNVTGLVFSKSSYARCGLYCLTTVINAGWEGELVLEYANHSSRPITFYAGMGAAQILFLTGTDCELPYGPTGQFQGQMGITLPKGQ